MYVYHTYKYIYINTLYTYFIQPYTFRVVCTSVYAYIRVTTINIKETMVLEKCMERCVGELG